MRTGWRAIRPCVGLSAAGRFTTMLPHLIDGRFRNGMAGERGERCRARRFLRSVDRFVHGGHFPDSRGRGAEEIVLGHSAAYRWTASKTGSSVGTGTAGCIVTTGGVCPDDRKKSPNLRLWDGLAHSESLGMFGTTYLDYRMRRERGRRPCIDRSKLLVIGGMSAPS